MWVLRISSQVLGLTQQVLLAAEPLPKTIPAVVYKNQQKALLRHYYCGLMGWHVFFCCFLNYLFIVPLPSLACPPHGTIVLAGLILSISVTGSNCSFLGVREAQIPIAPGLKSLDTQRATSSVVLSSLKDVSLIWSWFNISCLLEIMPLSFSFWRNWI